MPDDQYDGSEIAIIGMACRFPGADGPEAFWRLLRQGKEALTELSDDDLRSAGLDAAMCRDPRLVRRIPVLEGIEEFDADFFGYTPLQARIMDPQMRLFLECVWESFEQAGYNPEALKDPVGVFTGAKTNTYLLSLFSNREFFRQVDSFQLALGNDLGSMATQAAYKFNLRGPSYALHTACSTSLVTVHLACQSLLLGECRMALAGGACINVPQKRGYLYHKGGLLSADGSCRTFDARADGSNFGNGVGVVLLKRLEQARADGDHIFALIRGSASNNDGAQKASYTAPGVEGQTAVLLEAMACSGVEADSVSYIEAHGTATDLGDSIEMLALTDAFRAATAKKGFCAIGSVKTNIGHLETAAGIAGLIKAALALHHQQIPPSLHFESPNPKIDFASSPFYVNTRLAPWPRGEKPRRAGVSSFGIGSANAHVILEEAPLPTPSGAARPVQLLPLSARSDKALAAAGLRLADHLEAHPETDLADAAYTLQTGRKEFARRRFAVCRSREEAVGLLRADDGLPSPAQPAPSSARPAAFLFPGLGDHYPGMAWGLYQSEPTFRRWFDRGADLLLEPLGLDLRGLLQPPEPGDGRQEESAGGHDLRRMLGRSGEQSGTGLSRTRVIQPLLFVLETALARLWMDWGVRPGAMIGYSLGEYVAAHLAGVISYDDALRLVAERAQLIDQLAPGAMLAVPLSEADAAPFAESHGLALAAVNGPGMCVLAGPVDAVARAEAEVSAQDIACRRLNAAHAFHSPLLEAAAEPLTRLAGRLEFKPPSIPYFSNLSGDWVTAAQAVDPSYWAQHMCRTVQFGKSVRQLLSQGGGLFVEVGPGQNLLSFLRQQAEFEEGRHVTLPSLRNSYTSQGDVEFLLASLGKLWSSGQEVDWAGFNRHEERRRVPLPTYPFERQRHWVEPVFDTAPEGRQASPEEPSPPRVTLEKESDMGDWFYLPTWVEAERPAGELQPDERAWLIFAEQGSLGWELARRCSERGCRTVRVMPGSSFEQIDDSTFRIDPGRPEDYSALLAAAAKAGPARIVHLWGVSEGGEPGEEGYEEVQERGFYSLLFLAQSLGRLALRDPLHLLVVTSGVQPAGGDEPLCPEKATVLGPARVIPQEFPHLTCCSVDLSASELQGDGRQAVIEALLAEAVAADDAEPVLAYRGGRRLRQAFEPRRLEALQGPPARLRQKGVYLITGGLGGLGLKVAQYLARTVQARLVLAGRSGLPPREAWEGWLANHDQDDAISLKLRSIRQMEQLGAEVAIESADVTDEQAVAALLDSARGRFGALHGVIHMAGIPGGGIIQLKTRQAARQILAPKVEGAQLLGRLLAGAELDFLFLFSSIASILGEFGQADYCGANAFLNAFAHKSARSSSFPTITADWDIWNEVGLAVYTEVPSHLKAWRQEMLEKAIRPEEGVEALGRLLEAGFTQVVVSAQQLEGRIELGRSFSGENFLLELEKARGAAAPPPPRPAAVSEGGVQQRMADIWQRVLGVERVGVDDNFFDIGGNSLLGLQLVSEIRRDLGIEVAPVTLFESPSVAALCRHLKSPEAEASLAESAAPAAARSQGEDERAVAVVGMAGRFPGAADVEQFWQNLCGGIESVTFFSEQELLDAGADPETLKDPRYVRAGAVLQDVDRFDAELFGYSPREAEVMDPQHRVFLECAWEALEHSGCNPQTYPGAIGVFAGANLSTYLLHLYSDPEVRRSVNMLQAILGNDKDSLTTTVSYKLNLRGPSVAVQTFCSTSLVAVHMAVQSLRSRECDMALAGGIRIVVPDRQGYLYEEGGIAPPDGRTRPFDAQAKGSILSQGVGLVALKRLSDALSDGDHIHAVIRGTAINNDGSLKAGYTAPSVAGQVAAAVAAYRDAGVDPRRVGYLEAHGSATEIGDPLEVTALTKAFRRWTGEGGFCRIGSVKGNVGHLDRAAGVAGLIKAVLALERGTIPPSINFEAPNPQIDFQGSPFRVASEASEWKSNGGPRFAAVNALGIGGTNVHLVLEEAPAQLSGSASRPWQLLLLSANSQEALAAMGENLARYFEEHPQDDLPDAAFTLQTGRQTLGWRRALVCRDSADAAGVLRGGEPKRSLSAYCEEGERSAAFLFPGLGGQYLEMGRGLYDGEPAFRAAVDRCAELLEPHLGLDLRQVIYPSLEADGRDGREEQPEAAPEVDLRRMLRRDDSQQPDPAAERLNRTETAQPALFVLEYALAQLWMEWGIRPQAMVGYSLGEYVAACLAGVFSLEDALMLVAGRARLISGLESGAMTAVALPEEETLQCRGEGLSLAALNAPEQTVVSGPTAAVAALESELESKGVVCRRLETTHAFHSCMMEAIYDEVAQLAGSVELRPAQIPYLSNLTGRWLTPEEAADPEYWARHMCRPVRFSEALQELAGWPGRILLELGPGQVLGSLALQHPASRQGMPVLSSLGHAYENKPDQAVMLNTLGKLWLAGAKPDWQGFYAHEKRRRTVLPAYPFQRRRYWIDAVDAASPAGRKAKAVSAAGGGPCLHVPGWKLSPPLPEADPLPRGKHFLILADQAGLGRELSRRLAGGNTVTTIEAGEDGLDSASLEGFPAPPAAIVHLRSLDIPPQADLRTCLEYGFTSLLRLAEAIESRYPDHSAVLRVVTPGLQRVVGDEKPLPAAAALLGACQAIGRRYPNIACRIIDILPPAAQSPQGQRLADLLLAEVTAGRERRVAYRSNRRWLADMAPVPPPTPSKGLPRRLKQGGVYLVTDAFGALGGAFAEYLALTAQARLVLVEPAGFPDRGEWQEWLESDSEKGLISREIERILAWEEAGAEVLTVTADASEEGSMEEVLRQAEERFGRKLEGLVHVADAATAMGDDPAEPFAAGGMQFRLAAAPDVLQKLVRGLPLDFALLVSPAAMGEGPQAAAFAALGALFDAFADRAEASGGQPWTSVLWNFGPDDDASLRQAALDRLFSLSPVAQLALSPVPLEEGYSRLTAFQEGPPPARTPVGFYPRPSLRVEYAPPRSETEKAVAEIWKDLLGLERVGVHDNFLELGGDSLLASRLVIRMRQSFQVDLPIRLLFEASTVGELAQAVEEKKRSEDEQRLQALLERVKGLSDEELDQEILKRQTAARSASGLGAGGGVGREE